MENTTLLINEREKEDARALTQSFARNDVKSRAYINALGAQVCLKYLKDENISAEPAYNLHNIRKILEEFDISDIMLSNIHIDVRVVFDENQIFIPKSHFDYNLTPDIYVVLKLAKDHSNIEFLGFFEPKMINKNNTNGDYYFMEKEKLFSPVDLKNFIENFNGNTSKGCSDKEIEDAEFLIVSMADHNISDDDKKKLIGYLKQSADLRDKFIEFESFEMLSYQAVNSIGIDTAAGADEVDIANLSSDLMPEDVAEDIENSNIENLSGAFDDEEASSEGSLEDLIGGTAVLGAEIAGSAAVSAALSGTGEALEAADAVKDVVDSTANIVNAAAHVANNVSDAIDMASSIQNMAEQVFGDENPKNSDNSEDISNSAENSAANSADTAIQDLNANSNLNFDNLPGVDSDAGEVTSENSADIQNNAVNSAEVVNNAETAPSELSDNAGISDDLNELNLNMADLTLPDSAVDDNTADLSALQESDFQTAPAEEPAVDAAGSSEASDFGGNLDDLFSGIDDSSAQVSDDFGQAFGAQPEEPVFTTSDSYDEITFTNNDDYDDIIFENNPDDYGSSSSSSGAAPISSGAGSSRRPSISTVVHTPISEATELTSLEDIQLGNIPPSNIPKNVEDQMETMEMDEFHNLVNSYVPQEIKNESETVDFNSISSQNSGRQNSSADESFQDDEELADLSTMPEGKASVEVPVERYEDDEYEEELPDINELENSTVKNIADKSDDVTSDAFVEDISEIGNAETS